MARLPKEKQWACERDTRRGYRRKRVEWEDVVMGGEGIQGRTTVTGEVTWDGARAIQTKVGLEKGKRNRVGRGDFKSRVGGHSRGATSLKDSKKSKKPP